MTALAVNVLGVFEVRVGDRLVDVPRGRTRALLAVLALSAGQAVGIETLAARLWESPGPVHPRAAVHTVVRRLRGHLDADLIKTRAGGYLLDITPDRVDALRFSLLVRAAAHDTDRAQALATLRTALSLWRGEPLTGVDDGQAFDRHRTVLTARYLDALEHHAELELAEGRYETAIPELRALTERDPLRESAWHRLMLALHAVGRPAEALDCYTRVRDELRRALSREPSADLRELHRAILTTANTPAPGVHAPGPAPHQLPADTAGLVGRDDAVAELDRLLHKAEPGLIVVVDGAAGTGKTALAVHWAHRVRDRFTGELHADLRTSAPDRILAAFLRALGLPPHQIPDGVAQRSAVLRSLLDTRPTLLLLDDAQDAEQVRPLLPGSGVVVVTSRNQLRGLATREGAKRVTLDRLPEPAAVTLLADALGPTRAAENPAAVRDLANACGRLPLALRILGERVRRRETPLPAIAAELHDEQALLSTLADPADPTIDLGALLSWSYRTLDPDTAELFHRLAHHPGDIDLPTATALTGKSPSRTATLLDQLVAAHLIEQPHPHRYHFHDLVRKHAMSASAPMP